MFLLRPKTVKKGHQRGLSAVPTITAATTATNCFTTTLSWNRPDLRTLFVPPLPPRFHGTYQVYLDRAVWAGWQLWRPFLFLLRPKTVKKGHQRGLSAVPTITAATTATNCFTTTLSWNRPDLRTLFVPPLPPRFHGTYQVYLDRAVWAGWQLWRPFLFLLRPKTVKKGHQRGLSAVPTITAATTATNCFTTTLSWNRPDLRTLFVPPFPPRFHGTYQVYLDRAVWAGWQLWRPFLFLLRPKTVKKGHQRGLSAVPTITAATTATNCFTTTLSWNRPDLRTLFVPPLPPRFHGTYQVYLDRAVWAGWQLWRPFLFLLRPKTVKKGHQTGLSAVPTITAANTATNCFTTTLSWNRPDLRTLFVPPLPPRFHGTYHIYLDGAVWAGWQLWRPFLFLLRQKTVKKGHQKGSVSSTYYYRCYYCY